jgi:hypothetical protein
MKIMKQTAEGFLASASAIALCVTFLWVGSSYLNPWVGIPVFAMLAAAFGKYCVVLVKRFSEKKPPQAQVKQAKTILMALPGVGLACWFFDVLSTVFVIDINQAGTELNPLGWPYSAPAALAYYLPIAFVTYYLLFTLKSKASFYGAAVLSAVTLFMAARNFFASLNNFSLGIAHGTAFSNFLILCIWSTVIITLAILNIAALKQRKQAPKQTRKNPFKM